MPKVTGNIGLILTDVKLTIMNIRGNASRTSVRIPHLNVHLSLFFRARNRIRAFKATITIVAISNTSEIMFAGKINGLDKKNTSLSVVKHVFLIILSTRTIKLFSQIDKKELEKKKNREEL